MCEPQAARTRGSIVRGEVNTDYLSATGGLGLGSAHAAFAPLGRGYRLVVPADTKVRHVEVFVGFRLLSVVFVGRTDEVDLASVARNEVAAADAGSVSVRCSAGSAVRS